MSILEKQEPEKVLSYFEKICSIPHGSGNTKAISEYCEQFAAEKGLDCVRDGMGNVIIRAAGTKGYENSPVVILQGHLDMVCDKTPESGIDFEKDGLKLLLDGDNLTADGTTLGGDDGIAVACCLAILDSDDIPHPPLEVVFTVDEEVGMLGAAGMDMSSLKGRRMINIDSEEEGILTAGCAGGVTTVCHLPVRKSGIRGQHIHVEVTGLKGGHSGIEIDKGRANASKLLGRAVLGLFDSGLPIRVESLRGGSKENAIPREAFGDLIVFDPGYEEKLSGIIEDLQKKVSAEYASTDPDIKITIEFGNGRAIYYVLDEESTRHAITALVCAPDGIQRMSQDVKGLVQTSLNLGVMSTEEKEVVFTYCVRSSMDSEKEELVNRLRVLLVSLGGTVECSGDYSGWNYAAESELRDIMVQVYEEQYGNKPEVNIIHAGLECGFFSAGLKGLDCISIGPNIWHVHTAEETLELDSVRRTWDYLKAVLGRLK